MWRMKYISVVLVVTIITAVVGAVLWTSEETQTLDDGPANVGCEGWCLGPEAAPIRIATYADFT